MPDHGKNTTRQDDHYRRLFDEAPVAYHSVNFDGIIQEVNQTWLSLLGYPREEVVGHHIAEFIAPEFRHQFAAGFKQVQEGEPIRNKVMLMVRRNGTQVPIEVDVRSDFNTYGEAGRTYTMLRDVSDQPQGARERSNLARHHRLILNATPGAIIGYDENRKVTFANAATEQITGWSPQDLLGVDVHTYLRGRNPDGSPNPSSECSTCQAMINQEVVRGETRFQCKNGSFAPVEFQFQPFYVEGVYEGGVLSFSDLTERIAAQEKLQQSEEQLRHLFENAPVALWRENFAQVRTFLDDLVKRGITDLEDHFRTHPEDLRQCMSLVVVDDVNQAALDLHGAESLTELKEDIALTFTDDAVEVFQKELVALAHDLPGTKAITTVKTLAGEIRHVMYRVFRDLSGMAPDTAYVAFTDLTEARRMEGLSSRLATAIEQTGDSVIITDQNGSIQYCNPAFEKITGYNRDEVLGKTPRVIKSGHHDHQFYQDLWGTITDGRVWVGSFVNRRKDGEIFVEEGSISPVLDTEGIITNFVSVKRDVTHQLELERRMAQAQKMEAVGQLAGGVAHDFNNILHAMLGHLEFALDKNLDPTGVEHELRQMRESVDRASRLTRQLLAFSRRQVLELNNIDPNDLIAQLLKMVRRVIGEDIDLDFRPGSVHHEIHVDTGQIEQVLLNLCLNARDAMPDGGTLHIATGLVDLDEEFVRTHDWAKPGPHIRIAVRDTGEGIDAKVLPQIFEPFFTTKERGRGTGLGLATVYGTIKQHGGMVLVESELGQGTIFTILLPVAAPTAAPVTVDEKSAHELLGGTETILLAEDDASVRSVISRVLTRAGYQVLEAQNGKEALSIFDGRGDEIDLALLDLVMPAVGGPEVAVEIQARRPSVKIIFNTGYSEDAIRGRISPHSEAPLLMKPHDPRALLSCIRELLDGAPSS